MQRLVPRDEVLAFGLGLPALQVECIASPAHARAAARALAAMAVVGDSGAKYVDCAAVASVLDLPRAHAQLLLDTLEALDGGSSTGLAGACKLSDVSLYLMALLFDRESHKLETQDHYPDAARGRGAQPGEVLQQRGHDQGRQQQPDMLQDLPRRCCGAAGSPGGGSSRLLVKNQLQLLQQQHAAHARYYSDFLSRHAPVLLELAMDDSSAAETECAAALHQHKGVQLQLPEPQPTQLGSSLKQPAAQGVPGSGMPQAAAPEPGLASRAAAGRHESQGSPDREQQLQQLLCAGREAGSRRSSAVPPVSLTAAEFDRLSFLLELRAGAGGPPAARPRLSSAVPGFARCGALPMDELLSWMRAAWGPQQQGPQQLVQQQQQQQQQQSQHIQQQEQRPTAGSAARTTSAAAGASAGVSAVLAGSRPHPSSPAAAGAAPAPVQPSATRPQSARGALMAGLAATDSGAGGVAGWLGLASSPPDSTPLAAAQAAGERQPVGTSSPGHGPGPGLGNGLLPAGASSSSSSGPGGVSRINTGRGAVAVGSGAADAAGVRGCYRGTIVRGPADVAPVFTVADCAEATIYLLAPFRLVRLVNCTDCTIAVGAVAALLRIERCERLQLSGCAAQVVVLSCHSCCLHLGTPRQPVLLGDCRFVALAPLNSRYEAISEHLTAARIPAGQPSLWDQPLVLPGAASSGGSGGSGSGSGGVNAAAGGSGASAAAGSSSELAAPGQHGQQVQQVQQRRPGAAMPSSPHAHASSSGGAAVAGSSCSSPGSGSGSSGPGWPPVVLLPPQEFGPLVIPFRGTPGPLAGGCAHPASTAWAPGSHRLQAGPLPPLPFSLPSAYDGALNAQYAVVTGLRARIRGSGLDEARRSALQGVIQAHFREWLHSSGAIRQVYDLSKLEGDEVEQVQGTTQPLE